MVCNHCGSDNIIWDDGDYCWECEENVELVTLKDWINDRLEAATSAFVGCDIYRQHTICLRSNKYSDKMDFKIPSEIGDMILLHILTNWQRGKDQWHKPKKA